MLRILLGLTLALTLNDTCRSQETVITRDHSCEGESPCGWDVPACESAWRPSISVVFLGRAAEIRKEDVPILLDNEKALTERLFVKFEVEESFIGLIEKEVTVTSGGDLCGFPFSKGHEYLLYGRRLKSGEIYVSICSGTKWKKDAGEDLKYLRGLPNAPPGATIFGTAFRFTEPEQLYSKVRLEAPEVGDRVTIQGTTQRYEVLVDDSGNFDISGLPPGRYQVSLTAKGRISTFPHVKFAPVDVAEKGCARFNFTVDPFGSPEEQKSPNDAPHALEKGKDGEKSSGSAW